MSRKAYFHELVSVNFGPRPLKSGDTETFKIRVRDGLESYKKRLPLLFPLLTTVAVTIIYRPPAKKCSVWQQSSVLSGSKPLYPAARHTLHIHEALAEDPRF
jgi:hypothetical protein